MHLITEDVFFRTRDRFGGDGALAREKFLMEQKHAFIDQGRLGRFAPELYERIIKGHEQKSKGVTPSITSVGPSLNNSLLLKEGINPKFIPV